MMGVGKQLGISDIVNMDSNLLSKGLEVGVNIKHPLDESKIIGHL